ncbi:helix-turn-helix domain-containing protein [Kitasatospora sp. NPDC092948]|uniref:helix-turn-helix domain-containing protein n=1 Tax=Kitasatospora sp. NPDC092948 TaxID=3364088 RepID=UPI0037F7BA66
MDFALELCDSTWFAPLVTPNGTAIRTIRESQNLSLRVVASKARLSPGFISKVERGKARARQESLRRIATALGVPVAAINREELS